MAVQEKGRKKKQSPCFIGLCREICHCLSSFPKLKSALSPVLLINNYSSKEINLKPQKERKFWSPVQIVLDLTSIRTNGVRKFYSEQRKRLVEAMIRTG